MFNDTIENSEFPDVKLAGVMVTLKIKNKSPVSIFTAASKTFERTVHQQMSIFVGMILSSNWGLKSFQHWGHYTVGIYLLKVNNRNNKRRCEICSKLTIKTPERHWRRSGVFNC